MDPLLVKADICFAEHRARVARAERFRSLLSMPSTSAAPRRTTAVAASDVLAVFRAVGAALSRVAALAHDSREGLRSPEHEVAARGVRWQTDAAYDQSLAEEVQAARSRGLAAEATVPPPPSRPTRRRGAATRDLRGTIGRTVVRAGERLRGFPHPAATGVIGQSGSY